MDYNGEPIIGGTDVLLMNEGQQLVIESAAESDAGRYSCVAENRPGRIQKDLVVAVLKPPQMVEDYRLFEVPANQAFTLECPIEDEPVDVKWSKNQIPLTTSNNLQVSSNGLKVHIVRVQSNDAGVYTCNAWNDAGEAATNLELRILMAPKIVGPAFRTVEAVLNQTVSIECKATGTPAPQIIWTLDGEPISASESSQVANNGTKLILSVLDVNQEGRYSCIAANKVGRTEVDTFLQVSVPPRVIMGAENVKAIEGQTQTINCFVTGIPMPKVVWLKNGQPVDALIVQASVSTHSIHLRQVHTGDAGRYTCIARNRAGEHRMSTQLHVLVAPTIADGERMIQVKESVPLTLECLTSGIPKPEITWRRDGRLIPTTGSQLTIASAKKTDAGRIWKNKKYFRYTCEAVNEAGKVSVDFEVDIFVRPKFDNLTTTELRVMEGERVRLECKVSGHPEPTIVWMRGGRPIDGMRNIILSPRGETLMILKAQRADGGGYSCLAKNTAGEAEIGFTVTVLVRPHIAEHIDQNPRVIQNSNVVLHCPAQGNPPPEIHWFYDGELLADNQTDGSRDLTINTAQALILIYLIPDKSYNALNRQSHGGRYTCEATNEAGILVTNYELEIIGRPKFHRRGKSIYEVVVNKTVTMDCEVDTVPKPEIIWYRGDAPIYLTSNVHISPEGEQITIRDVQVSDGGKYTCRAQNEAGSADIDLTLKVLVPPTIDTANIIGNPLAVAGRSIYLECPVTGIPQPVVTWYKNNIPVVVDDEHFTLEQNNQTFGIKNVEVPDQGQYLCVVENRGGRVQQTFNLQVIVPPELEIDVPQKLVKLEKESVTLLCPVKQTTDLVTPTEIFWYKDGRQIDANTATNIKFSSIGQRLHIPRAALTDAGNYACVALNRAGEASLEFTVEILSKPRIDSSRNEPQLHTVAGQPVTLWCVTTGHPFPKISWYKDLHPVSPGTNIRFKEKGQGLEILVTKPEHSGLWSCEASNKAGKAESEINLDIWTAPLVKIEPEDNVYKVDDSAIIECRVSGNPEPSLLWSKNGRPLMASAEGTRITVKGSRLDISRIRQSHAGEYTCTAVNDVGSGSSSVHVDVLIPPLINRENVELNPRLPTAQTLTLLCDATGKPMPELKWLVNDTVIDKQSQSAIIIAENGQYLQIHNVSLHDRGTYKCLATNIAGSDELPYDVTIVQAPWVSGGGTHQVIEGYNALISCNVEGEPQPVVTWQRNGVRVETDARYVVDKALKIIDVRSSDSGLYVCVATNEAGTTQQAFTLEVLVSPRIITTSPSESVVPINHPFSLRCGARGYPPPEIVWTINDQAVGDHLASYSVADDGTLFVEKAQKDLNHKFKCTARNSAGLDEKEYQIRTISNFFKFIFCALKKMRIIRSIFSGSFKLISNFSGPPTIVHEGIKMVNATEGDPSLLVCEIVGQSREIHWYKDGAPLSLKRNIELSEDRTQIKIHESKLHDEGLYTCVAVNPAGNATQKLQLFVGVPPRITEKPRRIMVKQGQPAELWCEAIGIPKPHITWLKNDKALPQTALDDHSEKLKSTALFANVSSENAGIYTCKAENWAGTSYKDVDLIVLIPPQIQPERINVTANVGEMIILTCNTSGVPEPVISWVKMPNIDIIGNDEKYQLFGTALSIKNVTLDDDGYYHCVAKSNAGQAIGFRHLAVLIRDPKKYKMVWVECDETGQPIKTTFIPARGDVPDSENTLVPWKQQVQELQKNGTDGILIRCLPGARKE